MKETHSSSNMSRRCTASIPASASTEPGPAFPITAPPAAAANARRPRSAGPAEEEEETARRAHARRPAPSDAEAEARSAKVGRAAGAAAMMGGVGGEMRCAHG